jgi:hypothetical protein
MRLVRFLSAAWLAVVLPACGGSNERVPVTGTVTLDERPLGDALVTFYPTGDTSGLGGSGRTGQDGKYTLTPARGDGGLPTGDYVVVISRPLRPDGSPPLPDEKPIETDARETLSPIYSSRQDSILRAKVTRESPGHDFALTKAKK